MSRGFGSVLKVKGLKAIDDYDDDDNFVLESRVIFFRRLKWIVFSGVGPDFSILFLNQTPFIQSNVPLSASNILL